MSVAKTGDWVFIIPAGSYGLSIIACTTIVVYDTYPGTDDLAYIEKNIYTFGLVRDKRSV